MLFLEVYYTASYFVNLIAIDAFFVVLVPLWLALVKLPYYERMQNGTFGKNHAHI